jgi:hypothetical protein
MDLANITASIRVDADTKKGSVIDVIRLVNPKLSSSNAGNTWAKLASAELGIRYTQVRINGKGKLTPVADARALMEIVWVLPGKAARDVRRASAQTVCRMLGGDLALVQEIEHRHHTWQESEEGRAAQDFLVPAVKRRKVSGPLELEGATASQRQLSVDAWLAKQQDEIVHQRVLTLKSALELMQMLGGVDDRDKIEFRDRIRLALRPPAASPHSSDTLSTLTVAAPVVDPGVTVPTPDCDDRVRGCEISIPLVASELSIVVGDKAGQVGKRMKFLYGARYGAHAAQNLPKRKTLFRGKPVLENTYYTRDKDLLIQAVQDITGQRQGSQRSRNVT